MDTDILSEVIKGRDATVCANAAAYVREHGHLSVAACTVAEVVRGYASRSRVAELDAFLKTLASQEVVPLTTEIAVLGGRIDAALTRGGGSIGRIDPLIAATAVVTGLVLVTGNTRHFERVVAAGFALLLEDWRSARS
ncbi:MAG: PIN domain-containing protein [Lacipirellulaceae bacterium]